MNLFGEFAGCFRFAKCEPKSENQNITAYGLMFFVSELYCEYLFPPKFTIFLQTITDISCLNAGWTKCSACCYI